MDTTGLRSTSSSAGSAFLCCALDHFIGVYSCAGTCGIPAAAAAAFDAISTPTAFFETARCICGGGILTAPRLRRAA